MKNTHRYKIGDIVWVVKPGHSYNQYTDMYRKMGFATDDNRISFNKFTRAKIFATEMHQDGKDPLYGIRDYHGDETLVGEKAISLVTSVLNTELTETPDEYVEFDTIRPDKMHIKWHPDTRMVTLPGLRMDSRLAKRVVGSPNVGKVQILRLYNPETDNYADYVQTGWNDTYSHYMDSVYNTHLRLDAMNN